MNPKKYKNHLLLLITVIAFNTALAQDETSLDAAFERLWASETAEQAEEPINGIINSGISFEDAYARLQQGRHYGAAETGTIMESYRAADGNRYYYHMIVPDTYDPVRQYPVSFHLHGGIGGRDRNEAPGRAQLRLDSDPDQIYVLPYAWNQSPWWSEDQVENLRHILDLVKRDYNVDENRVSLAGISDGGTGAFYIAMRETTRFASFQSLIGYIMVLANSSIDDGSSFPVNLINKPWLVINGGRDRLYPTSRVTPVIEYLQGNGVTIDYHPLEDAEHNTRWWPEMRETFADFVTAHPRDPHPAALRWRSNGGSSRAHWLIIESIAPQLDYTGNLQALEVDKSGAMFRPREDAAPAGLADVRRDGNVIEATIHQIGAFRMLLSPEVIDFRRPVTLLVNGGLAFQGMLEPELRTLLEWAARDKDRKMLYGAELGIRLSDTPTP